MKAPLTFENLETPRLHLVAPEVSQAEDIFEAAKNPNVSKWLTWYPHTTVDDSLWFLNHCRENFLSNESINWVIQDKTSGKSIGAIGLMKLQKGIPEIGYWIGEPYWGTGIMSEALTAVIGFARSQAFSAIYGQHCKENLGSGKVMMKNGFVFTEEREIERKGNMEIACEYRLNL